MDYQQYRTFRGRAVEATAPLRLDCMNPVKALAPLTPAAPARVVPVSAANVTAAWLDLFRVPGAAGLALATSGVRPALRAVFALLARRGYEVWLPEDVYPAYWELAREQGPASKPFTTCPTVALDALAAAGPRSAALLPCPLAPAGRHLTGAEVETLRSWLAESPQRRLILDAVYLFDNRLDAAALALWGTGRAFVLHSLAKAWLAPATLGTVLAPPDAVADLRPLLAPPQPEALPLALFCILDLPEHPRTVQRAFERRWQQLRPRIATALPSWRPPATGYFSTLSLSFAELLRRHNWLAVPASVFGARVEHSVITCLYYP